MAGCKVTLLTFVNAPYVFFAFFFHAEDGIRDGHVTGVQTCALPISAGRIPCDGRALPHRARRAERAAADGPHQRVERELPGRRDACGAPLLAVPAPLPRQIGRASCREIV